MANNHFPNWRVGAHAHSALSSHPHSFCKNFTGVIAKADVGAGMIAENLQQVALYAKTHIAAGAGVQRDFRPSIVGKLRGELGVLLPMPNRTELILKKN